MNFTRRALALPFAILVMAVVPIAADAATITVNTEQDTLGGGCSLRAAVLAANSDAPSGGCPAGGGADTIELPAGYYRLSIPGANEDAGATGDLDVKADLTLHGAGAGKTTIDAARLDRAVDTAAGTNVAIRGVTVTGGQVPDGASGPDANNGNGVSGAAGGDGGGVRSRGAISLSDCAVEDNVAGDGGHGGGAAGPNGAPGGAGAVAFGGDGGAGGRGGGVFSAGPLSVTNCSVTGNRGGNGGNGGIAAGGNGGIPINAIGAGSPGGGGYGGDGAAGGAGGVAGAAAVTIASSTIAGDVGGGAGAGGFGFGGHGSDGSKSGTGSGGNGGSGSGGPSYDGGAGGVDAGGAASITDTTLRDNRGGDSSDGGLGLGADAGLGGFFSGYGGYGGYGAGGSSGKGGAGAFKGSANANLSRDTLSFNRGGAGGVGADGSGGRGGTGGNNAGHGGGAGGGAGGNGGNGGDGGASTTATSNLTNVTIHGNIAGDGKKPGNGEGGDGGWGGPGGGIGGNGGSGSGAKGGSGGAGGLGRAYGTTQVLHGTIDANSGGSGTAGTAGIAGIGGASGGGGAGSWGLTFVGDNGVAGAGILDGSSVVITNTIVAGNTPANCRYSTADGGHNITFGDAYCGGAHVDPQLGGLRDNGGPVQTEALHSGSPALDAVGCTGTDARGVPRPKGGACDIGAYEVAPAEAVTGAATGGATVTGTVVANGRATAFHFEYGTSSGYGSRTADVDAGNGIGPAAVSSDLSGLQPSTTYHYRLVATNGDGTSAGGDKTFTTPAAGGPVGGPGGGAFAGVIVRKGTVTVRKGVAVVTVTCPAGSVGVCAGKVVLTKAAKRRALKLGQAKIKIAAGKTVKLRVKLSKAGQRAVKKSRTPLKATATATASDGRGASKVTRASVKLRVPARR